MKPSACRTPTWQRVSPSASLPRANAWIDRPGAASSQRPCLAAKGTSSAGAWVEEHLGAGAVVQERLQGSSNWSSSYVLTTESGAKFFVKTARTRDATMFKGEALGLLAMHDTHTIRVPKVLHFGALEPGGGGGGGGGPGSFIVMEHLDIGRLRDQRELGRQLALMHLAVPKDPQAAAGRFGFAVNNTIGGTPQHNGWGDNWVDFFRERRLNPMLALAGDSRLSHLGAKLSDNLEALFEGVEVRPSVLHGDLWSGNIGASGGQPTIFDPASYYGHSECEFGMSWCAGFDDSFWQAYHEVLPKAHGFERRRDLYLFYHYCNHLVMFGSGYYGECEHLLQRLTRSL